MVSVFAVPHFGQVITDSRAMIFNLPIYDVGHLLWPSLPPPTGAGYVKSSGPKESLLW